MAKIQGPVAFEPQILETPYGPQRDPFRPPSIDWPDETQFVGQVVRHDCDPPGVYQVAIPYDRGNGTTGVEWCPVYAPRSSPYTKEQALAVVNAMVGGHDCGDGKTVIPISPLVRHVVLALGVDELPLVDYCRFNRFGRVAARLFRQLAESLDRIA